MRKIGALFAALCFVVVLVPILAFSQDTGVVSKQSFLYDIWTIVQPLVVLLVSIVGPVLVTWIAVRLTSLLNIQDESKRKEVEKQVRDALHNSALNGLQYAMTRAGLPAGVLPNAGIIQDAIDYIRTKSPDTAEQAGVDDDDLTQIILSKVPDVFAKLAVVAK